MLGNDIPELLAFPGINRFFQMAIFKLAGLFRSQIVGQEIASTTAPFITASVSSAETAGRRFSA
jgi:hypothetical protein